MHNNSQYVIIFFILVLWITISAPLTLIGAIFLTDVFVPLLVTAVLSLACGSFVILWYVEHVTNHGISIGSLLFGTRQVSTQPDVVVPIDTHADPIDDATSTISGPDDEPPAFHE